MGSSRSASRSWKRSLDQSTCVMFCRMLGGRAQARHALQPVWDCAKRTASCGIWTRLTGSGLRSYESQMSGQYGIRSASGSCVVLCSRIQYFQILSVPVMVPETWHQTGHVLYRDHPTLAKGASVPGWRPIRRALKARPRRRPAVPRRAARPHAARNQAAAAGPHAPGVMSHILQDMRAGCPAPPGSM